MELADYRATITTNTIITLTSTTATTVLIRYMTIVLSTTPASTHHVAATFFEASPKNAKSRHVK
jgi:hypothetical protein